MAPRVHATGRTVKSFVIRYLQFALNPDRNRVVTDHLDDRTYAMLFRIRRSARYHSHRRRFFANWNTTTVALTAVLATSAAGSLLGTLPAWLDWVPITASFVVGALAALDLAVGTNRRADQHADLVRRHTLLERHFAHDRSLTDEEFQEVFRERLEVEASEPPILRLLDATCHFEVLRSLGGDPAKHPPIRLWRRILMHWISQTNYARALPSGGQPLGAHPPAPSEA